MAKCVFTVLPKARVAFGLDVEYPMLNIYEDMSLNQFEKDDSTRFG